MTKAARDLRVGDRVLTSMGFAGSPIEKLFSSEPLVPGNPSVVTVRMENGFYVSYYAHEELEVQP